MKASADHAMKVSRNTDQQRAPRLKYPEGYISDPAERRRIARELRGSIPDIMTQEELRKMREES